MFFSDRRSDHLLVESRKEGLNSVAELVEGRSRCPDPEGQPLDGGVFLEIIEPLGGLRPPDLMLVQNHLEQQVRAVRQTASASVGREQGFQIQFLVDQASDLTCQIIFTKLAVDPQPFRRLAGPGRLGESGPRSLRGARTACGGEGKVGRRARQKRTKHVCRWAPTAVSI